MHTFQSFLLLLPILLFSVIAHEIAHGYAALKQGDRTALEAGRLSWNPVRHIDPYLTILLPLLMYSGSSLFGQTMVFGGAKPVPVDPRNYLHPRRGDIIVSLAGVATNLVIGLVCGVAIVGTGVLARSAPALDETMGILQAMLWIGVRLNFALILFNLLPIPPLDGSHVMKYLLPRPLAIKYVQFGRYGMLLLILLLFMGGRVLDVWFQPAVFAIKAIYGFAGPYFVAAADQWMQ